MSKAASLGKQASHPPTHPPTYLFIHPSPHIFHLPVPHSNSFESSSSPLSTHPPQATHSSSSLLLIHPPTHPPTYRMTALTSLLGQHTGLLSLSDRSEEVASMFDALLSLSLPLPLKSRLYRSIAQAVGRGGGGGKKSSAAVPLLAESMSKRLGRFLLLEGGGGGEASTHPPTHPPIRLLSHPH